MSARFRFDPSSASGRLHPGRMSVPALALCLLMTAGCSDRHVEAEAHAGQAPSAAPVHDVDAHAAHAPTGAHKQPTVPTLPATRWASDPPLRDGMRRMHRAVEALAHAEHGHLDAAQSTAAARQVQDAANDMIANCKLPAEPDAALHGLLSTLLSGATAITANPADTGPVSAMRDALALYPRMFDDPLWDADTATAD